MGSKPHSQPHHREEETAQATPPPPPPLQHQPHKKQVRRRLHTSRPYQERLLNMAEARREIVSALKVHRASMRQAKEQQQLLQLQQQQEAAQAVQEQGQVSRIAACAPMSYASFSDYLYNSPFAHFTATSSSSYYSSPLPYQTPMVDAFDHLLPLPTQPLGLNLSFQGFDAVAPAGADDDAKNSTASFDRDPLLHHQPSPASSYSVYSSPPVTMASHDMSSAVAAAASGENASLVADASLHRVLDEQEMAAIYSIGQQHDVEWSDTVNLVTSAWWSKLLESIEGGGEGTSNTVNAGVEDASSTATHTLDWFCGDVLGHQGTKGSDGGSDVLGVHRSDHYGEDVSLPRMDIGEIQGWDAEWFS
uniref:Uncharacterized protein n=1 Tax=Avena sativa TaxID=4498 RepID=A0ACD5Y823_AVESA